jgi:hypothetical protein
MNSTCSKKSGQKIGVPEETISAITGSIIGSIESVKYTEGQILEFDCYPDR